MHEFDQSYRTFAVVGYTRNLFFWAEERLSTNSSNPSQVAESPFEAVRRDFRTVFLCEHRLCNSPPGQMPWRTLESTVQALQELGRNQTCQFPRSLFLEVSAPNCIGKATREGQQTAQRTTPEVSMSDSRTNQASSLG